MLGFVWSAWDSVSFTKPLVGLLEQSHVPGGSFPKTQKQNAISCSLIVTIPSLPLLSLVLVHFLLILSTDRGHLRAACVS